MEEFRGPAVYLGICDDTEPCSHCDDLYDRWEFYRAPAPAPIRYRLQLPNYAELRCVRAESFTAVVPDATAAAAPMTGTELRELYDVDGYAAQVG